MLPTLVPQGSGELSLHMDDLTFLVLTSFFFFFGHSSVTISSFFLHRTESVFSLRAESLFTLFAGPCILRVSRLCPLIFL